MLLNLQVHGYNDHPLFITHEYVLKLRHLLLLISLLLLQSCQHAKEPKQELTASYNTQLGLAYLKQGDRERAKRKLLLALAEAPNSPDVNAAMAYFMEQCKEMRQAQRYYKKAMDAAPGRGAQLNNYGAYLCRQGQYKQAEPYFLKAVSDIKYEHTAGAYENAGLCAMAIPDYTKAAVYFGKALEQDPRRQQSLFELVNIAVKQGHLNRALAYLQKYPNLTFSDRTLMALAVNVARKAGKAELEVEYNKLLLRMREV